jgi:hypothetical protein
MRSCLNQKFTAGKALAPFAPADFEVHSTVKLGNKELFGHPKIVP